MGILGLVGEMRGLYEERINGAEATLATITAFLDFLDETDTSPRSFALDTV